MRDVAPSIRSRPVPWFATLALLVGAGCSGGSSTATTGQVDDPEIAKIVKETKDPKKRRELISQAMLRRGDPDLASAPPATSKPARGKMARKR